MKKIPILIVLALVIFFSITFGQTANCGPEGTGYRLCVPIPGQRGVVTDIADYVKFIYQFILGAAGVIVFVRITYAGIQYTLAAANPANQKEALAIIKESVLGFVLLMIATMMLYLINPEILNINYRFKTAPDINIQKIPEISGPFTPPPGTSSSGKTRIKIEDLPTGYGF